MKGLLCLLLLCSSVSFAQRRIDVDYNVTLNTGAFYQTVNGVPVMSNTYYRVVEGSAFYGNGWMKGTAIFSKDRGFGGLILKLDLLKNELHFRDTKGNELICETPLYRLGLTDSLTGATAYFTQVSSVPGLTGLKPEQWVEILADGPVQLITFHKKTVSESQPYGSATLEQRIYTVPVHFVVADGKSEKIKRVSDIVKMFSPDKRAAAQTWIRANVTDERDVAAMTRLVDWYNSGGK